MTLAFGLALAASLVFGAEPGEAVALSAPPLVEAPKPKIYQLDAPFAVVQDGETLLELDAGVVMPLEGYETLDREFRRLQVLEAESKPDHVIWFAAGSILGGIVTAGLLIGLFAVTR